MIQVILLLIETIRLSMDLADSRFLHVWYKIDSVDSTGRTNGITVVDKAYSRNVHKAIPSFFCLVSAGGLVFSIHFEKTNI